MEFEFAESRKNLCWTLLKDDQHIYTAASDLVNSAFRLGSVIKLT